MPSSNRKAMRRGENVSNLESLRFQRFRFILRCQTALQLNEFVGNDLRGAFGAVLRRTACLVPNALTTRIASTVRSSKAGISTATK